MISVKTSYDIYINNNKDTDNNLYTFDIAVLLLLLQ